MAKGKFRRYIAGPIDEEGDLGTLSAKTAVRFAFDETVVEKAWITSIDAIWALKNFTIATDDGPIMVGIAHSDYTATEIEEWIENAAGWSEADLVGQEVAKRKIRKVGVFDSPNAALDDVVLNDGKSIHTKCGWMLASGQGLALWAYNLGDSNLATTAPDVFVQGTAHVWPR